MVKHARQQQPQQNDLQQRAARKRNNDMASSIVRHGHSVLGLKSAQDMLQQNQSTTLSSPNLTTQNIINFVPKNVGLLKRIRCETICTFTTASGTSSCALSSFGPANIFSNITFTDFQGQQRINCPGWALSNLATFRSPQQAPIASAETSDTPLGYGNIIGRAAIQAPSTVAASGSATVYMIFDVPVAYADNDLRGGIWTSTTGANLQLQLTLNQNFFLTSSGDAALPVYVYAGTAPTLTGVTVNFYQNYLDQLPLGQNNKVILPTDDLNTTYNMQWTTQSGFTVNNQLGIPYSNLRTFMSTTLVYSNAGVLNNGSDIGQENGFGLQVANNAFIWQYGPQMVSYLTRQRINADTPKGMYFFSHRGSPIETDQYGNEQFVFYPTTVTNSTAYIAIAYEFFQARTTVTKSASLPSS